jgi:site-specific DNA-methyltransferase (adenine-specific)
MGGEHGRTKKTFNINKEKVSPNIWNIAVARNKSGHPAIYPLEIPLRHIKSWTNVGDIVFDPFLGSGTTCIGAIRENRKFIGVEIDKTYFDVANKIIEEELNIYNK